GVVRQKAHDVQDAPPESVVVVTVALQGVRLFASLDEGQDALADRQLALRIQPPHKKPADVGQAGGPHFFFSSYRLPKDDSESQVAAAGARPGGGAGGGSRPAAVCPPHSFPRRQPPRGIAPAPIFLRQAASAPPLLAEDQEEARRQFR